MPRAARAILAIAVSAGAGALRPDVGLVGPNAFPCGRSKQIGALKHKWRTRLRVECEQDELSPWMGTDEGLDLDDFPDSELCTMPAAEDSDSSEADESLDESSEGDVTLPEALVMNVMTYAGVHGRLASRSARKQCDECLHEGLQLPEFPVNIRIKQHYKFGDEESTSTWSLELPTASSNGAMDLRTEVSSDGEGESSSQKSVHSNSQMMNLWQQLRALRSDSGVRYKESGDAQVEIEVTDGSKRIFLDHKYKRRALYNKADEILESISEAETAKPTALAASRVENGVVRSRYLRARSVNRPTSM